MQVQAEIYDNHHILSSLNTCMRGGGGGGGGICKELRNKLTTQEEWEPGRGEKAVGPNRRNISCFLPYYIKAPLKK